MQLCAVMYYGVLYILLTFYYVVFVDDDNKNVVHAKELNLNNLTVIKAWKN